MNPRRLTALARFVALNPSTVVEALKWRTTLWRLSSGFFSLPVISGTVQNGAIAVVMCLWNRPSRIGVILRQLDEQDSPRRIRLVLWNNNLGDNRHYREEIERYALTGSLASVELHTSRWNVGGLARFILARRLLKTGYAGTFIMLDDDQNLESTVIATLLSHAAPQRINGWWAFNNRTSYWDREAVADGAPADHVGTGGCAVDIAIVQSQRFFTRLPRRYAFLEDQWMCWYARTQGWSIQKTAVGITAVMEESNQYHGLVTLKDEFWRHLNSLDRTAAAH